MNSRDGTVMYQMDKQRRAELLAEFGPSSYHRNASEFPTFSLALAPGTVKVTLILTSLAAAFLIVASVI